MDIEFLRQSGDNRKDGWEAVNMFVRIEMRRAQAFVEEPFDLCGKFGFNGVTGFSAEGALEEEFGQARDEETLEICKGA